MKWQSGYATNKVEVLRSKKEGGQGSYTHFEAIKTRFATTDKPWCLEQVVSNKKRYTTPKGQVVFSQQFGSLPELEAFADQLLDLEAR